ncbi:MAG TPA: cytochrome c3 family protein [Opitutaceae bacterium]
MSKVFPKWINTLPLKIVIFAGVVGGTVTAGITYYFTPKYTRVGYEPVQPVPFSHALHAGQLGMDCRYCHVGVEKSAHSTIPASQTCMNCHTPGMMPVNTNNPRLAPVQVSFESGVPVPWVKVHQNPDYVYFNHAVHVNRGVSCVECHGKVNEMEVVRHEKPLSMAFCLECHRDPAGRIRDPRDVFNLDSQTLVAQGRLEEAHKFIKDWNVIPPQSCSGCHR